MNKTTEALKLSEEALDELRYSNDTDIAKTKYYKALAAIRKALEEQAEQELVGYLFDQSAIEGNGWIKQVNVFCSIDPTLIPLKGACNVRPVYSAPVKQAEQEPVAWRVRGYSQFKTGNPAPWRYVDGADKPAVNNPDCCDFTPLYAAPVSIEAAVVAEREACAKVCEETKSPKIRDEWSAGQITGCSSCAAAIRARGDV